MKIRACYFEHLCTRNPGLREHALQVGILDADWFTVRDTGAEALKAKWFPWNDADLAGIAKGYATVRFIPDSILPNLEADQVTRIMREGTALQGGYDVDDALLADMGLKVGAGGMILNAAQALVAYLQDNRDVPDNVLAERKAHCEPCPFGPNRENRAEGDGKFCLACGCREFKLELACQRCPLPHPLWVEWRG